MQHIILAISFRTISKSASIARGGSRILVFQAPPLVSAQGLGDIDTVNKSDDSSFPIKIF